MPYINNIICSRAALAALLLLILPQCNAMAQARQLLTWRTDLAYLQSVSDEELIQNRAAIEQMRRGIEFYLKFNPSSKVELASEPQQVSGATELRNEVIVLSTALESIIREDPNRPFDLGTTIVSVSAEASSLSPVTDSLIAKDVRDRQILTVTEALRNLPGVLAVEPSGSRNEAYGRIRGFSTVGQVGFYRDGIPIYVPYDGYADLNRFLLSDVAEIQVTKGYSSPLLGTNNMAGSINMVTREPKKKLDVDGLLGTGSGSQLLSSIGIGSRWEKFYVQASLDWLERDFIPLSGNFALNKNQAN